MIVSFNNEVTKVGKHFSIGWLAILKGAGSEILVVRRIRHLVGFSVDG